METLAHPRVCTPAPSLFLTDSLNGAQLILTRSPPPSLVGGASAWPFRREATEGRSWRCPRCRGLAAQNRGGKVRPGKQSVRPELGFLRVSPFPSRELSPSAASAGRRGTEEQCVPGDPASLPASGGVRAGRTCNERVTLTLSIIQMNCSRGITPIFLGWGANNVRVIY